MVRRVAVVVVVGLLASCDDGPLPEIRPVGEWPTAPECEFEAILDEALGSSELVDCGTLGHPYDPGVFESTEEAEAVWLAGQACVQEHLDRREPFVVRFIPPLIDYGNDDNVYVGREIAGVWTIQMFVHSSDGTFNAADNYQTYAQTFACDDLRSLGACTADDYLFSNVCFECTNATKTSECKTN